MNKIRNLIPFPILIFVVGFLPAIPWIGIHFYQRLAHPLSDRFMALFSALFLLWLAGQLMLLWRICHEPFYSLANLVRSLYQGDYSQRSATQPTGDAIGTLYEEINILADILQNNRFAVVESMRQFQGLIDQLDIGVVSFDRRKELTMVNQSISKAFGKQPTDLIGKDIENLGLDALWESESGRTLWLDFPRKSSRYLVHRSQFREDGKPQRLFLLTDVQDPLRDEERTAWKRLIRVMGHELNNSLTPIISLSQSLKSRVKSFEIDENKQNSSIEALEIIAHRAQGLNRFIDDYSKLAKLPDPNRSMVDLKTAIQQNVALVGVDKISINSEKNHQLHVDPDQLDQMFINLFRNALEAIPEEDGRITVSWERSSTDAVIYIDDNGPGIEKGENLFVPFYSTKPNGSGIGLVLCRQIAEGNGGSIKLSNIPEGGCRVTLKLPLG